MIHRGGWNRSGRLEKHGSQYIIKTGGWEKSLEENRDEGEITKQFRDKGEKCCEK